MPNVLTTAYVKPYVKRQKNDAADAEAICEAVTRPSMRFVPVKSAERQGVMMLHRTRDLLMRQRTMMLNAIRAHLAEFGIITAQGPHKLAALLDAMDAAEKAGHGFVLVLAPREVARAGEITRLCQARQRRVHRRSELEGRHLVPGEVLVLDTLGELSALYATASIAFVGGTLVPVGGHNLVEPVHAGCPVLFGPRVENVRKVVEILEIGDAGRKVQNAAGLVSEVSLAFDDLEACRVRGEIGRETLEAHRGSVAATRRMIAEVLEQHASLLEAHASDASP